MAVQLQLELADIAHLNGDGGKILEQCLWNLVRSVVLAQGLSPTDIHRDFRAAADGGVDTQFDGCLVRDEGVFRAGAPFIVSCKSGDEGKKAHLFQKEIIGQLQAGGPDRTHIHGLLSRGYHFYWVSTLSLSSEQRLTFQNNTVIQVCSKLAENNIVVTPDQFHLVWADHLCTALSSDFSVAALYIPKIAAIYEGELRHWSLWHEYDHGSRGIPQVDWRSSEVRSQMIDVIKRHLLGSSQENVLHIAGISGIGKTRLAIQACAELSAEFPDTPPVRYQSQIDLEESTWFQDATNGRIRGLRVILDECPSEVSEDIRRKLHRCPTLRIITIGNERPSGNRTSRPGVRYLEPIGDEAWVRDLIAASHPALLANEALIKKALHWSQCASEAGQRGYDLRAALLLAKLLTESPQDADWQSFNRVWRRVLTCFPTELQEAYLQDFETSYALLTVGLNIDLGPPTGSRHKERTEEIPYLVKLGNFSGRSNLDKAVHKAKRCSLGFETPARYFEATPVAIANHVFREVAWPIIGRRHADLVEMPERLLKQFILRASVFPEISQEVARIFGVIFRRTIRSDGWDGLVRAGRVESFCSWTEISPTEGLAELREAVSEFGPPMNEARRPLVWLLESLSWFPEHWPAIEEILWAFSLQEYERSIANNSSGIWSGLFPAYGPNVTLSFSRRAEALIKRIRMARETPSSDSQWMLISAALGTALHFGGYVRTPSNSVGGRLIPGAWKPGKRSELRASACVIFDEATKQTPPHESVFDMIVRSVGQVAGIGALDQVCQNWMAWMTANDAKKRRFIAALDAYLNRHPEQAEKFPDIAKVRDKLIGQSLSDRIKRLTAVAWWDHRERSDEDYHKREERTAMLYHEMAKMCRGELTVVASLRDWFSDEECASAQPFGHYLGLDEHLDGDFDALIWQWLSDGQKMPRSLCFGFIDGRLKRNPSDPTWMIHLDELMGINRELALDFTAHIDRSKAGLERVLSYARADGAIFRGVEVMAHWPEEVVGPKEAGILLDWVVTKAEASLLLKQSSVAVITEKIWKISELNEAMRLARWWTKSQQPAIGKAWEVPLQGHLVRLLQLATHPHVDVDGHEVADLAQACLLSDAKFALQRITFALFECHHTRSSVEMPALQFLSEYARVGRAEALSVWKELVGYLEDKKWATKWRFSFPDHGHRQLITSIGPDLIAATAAVMPQVMPAVARQIPEPQIHEGGKLSMSAITHWFLEVVPAAGFIPQEVYDESFREFIFGNNTRGYSGPSRTREDSYLWTKQFLETNPSCRLAEWARMIVADYEKDIKNHEIEEDELEHG